MSEPSGPWYDDSYGHANANAAVAVAVAVAEGAARPEAPRGTRWEPSLSLEAMLAIGFAVFVLLVIGYDLAAISAAKHVICAKFLAKGQADCGGGDGFREWAPMIVSKGVPLLAIELLVVPVLAYGVGRIVKSVRSH